MTFLRSCLSALLGFLTLSLGTSRAESLAEPRAAVLQEGMVWQVSGGKVPFFLAGSFHVLRQADYPLPESYEIAWKEAQHVVMEVPPGEASKPENLALTTKLAFLKEGKLSELVSPEIWQKVTAWCGEAGYPEAAVAKMKPWMVGIFIAVAGIEKQGFKSDLGLEHHFSERLTKSEKTSEGLETFEQQLLIFDRISAPMQETMLKLALNQLATMEADLRNLVTAWRAGDTEKVDQLMSRSFEGYPEIKKQVLLDRNVAWIPRLEALLQGGRPTLVLVGAAHLCGPGSVVELLREKGYQCIPLKAAAVAPAPAPVPVKKAA